MWANQTLYWSFHTSSAVFMNVPLCTRWLCLDNSTVYLFSVQQIPPNMHSLQAIFHHLLITQVCSSAVFPLFDLLIYYLFFFSTCQSLRLIYRINKASHTVILNLQNKGCVKDECANLPITLILVSFRIDVWCWWNLELLFSLVSNWR